MAKVATKKVVKRRREKKNIEKGGPWNKKLVTQFQKLQMETVLK